jgi:hypothetical protein
MLRGEVESAVELTGAARLRVAFGRTAWAGLFVLALLVLVDVAVYSFRIHMLAVDASHSYVPAAHDLLHGRSPYNAAGTGRGSAFAYPPIAAFVFAPFTLLAWGAAEVVMSTLSLVAALAALWLVGLRDWRCYAITGLSYPLVLEFQTANLSALLALLAALLWRYRDRPLIAGAAAGASVALKLFGWPLIVFLLATRRFRAAAFAAVFALGGILVPWGAVGFVGFSGYPHMLQALTRHERADSYSLATVAARLTSSWLAGQGIAYLAVVALLIVAWRTSRPEHAFIAAVAATLAFTPIVWAHYFLLLLVALAVARPKFGVFWLLPLVFWISAPSHNPQLWRPVVVVLVAAAVAVGAVRSAEPGVA